jgi:ketosteroid isomerase-like protein
MTEQQNRDALDSFFEAFERGDLDAIFELFDDDYVEEYPQSGERLRGKDKVRELYENYPGQPNLIDRSYKVSGDLAAVEMVLDYDGKRIHACEITEFEGGKIKRSRQYFAEPFETPEWRAQWVEKM